MNNKQLLSRLFISALLVILFSYGSFAQHELLFPLKSNSVIKAELSKQSNGIAKISSATADTLFLPFFEDFSVASVWPSADRWSDSTAFINYNFPINPPTIGAATFDGLDKEGNSYDDVNTNAYGLCDEMTSKPINLFNDNNGLPYNASDSIFLVFYYQRKGRGDNPEANDSLTLQFLNPTTQLWVPIWKATGMSSGDTTFTKVKISIDDPVFRQNGFKLRFRNYGTLTGMLDIWNVDYIFLDKFLPPDYENIRDYAFVYQGIPLLNNYSSVPWPHFKYISTAQQQAFVNSATDLTIRNNNDAAPFPIKVAGTVYDQYNNPTPIIGGAGLNSIVVPLNTNVSPVANLLSNSFLVDPTLDDETYFTAVYELGQTSGGIVDDFSPNDTLRYVQKFSNYYSFDDGSAELAYGVSGAGAQLAYKFEVLKPDTLRSVEMFFAQSGLSVTNSLFRLAIWLGGSAGPIGAPVYEKFNQTPNYIDSINGFYGYNTAALFVPAGTYFFGYIQNSATILNLGLDTNTPAEPTRKFINYNGSWNLSQLPGMWMIRPVFSNTPLVNGVDEVSIENSLIVYPVPAKEFVKITINHPDASRMIVKITDIAGRNVTEPMQFKSELNVSELSAGIYFLQVFDPVTTSTYSRKLVIASK